MTTETAAEFMAAQHAMRKAQAACGRILLDAVCSEFPKATVCLVDGAAQAQNVLFRLEEGAISVQYVVEVEGRVTVTSNVSFREALASARSRSVRDALIRLDY